MRYEASIARLDEKYIPQLRVSNCHFVAEDLGLFVLAKFNDCSVSVAGTPKTGSQSPIRKTNHYVTVIRESTGELVALDATRPTYEEGKEYWMFNASTEGQLMRILSKHYGGKWSIQDKWLHEIPKWYTGFP